MNTYYISLSPNVYIVFPNFNLQFIYANTWNTTDSIHQQVLTFLIKVCLNVQRYS